MLYYVIIIIVVVVVVGFPKLILDRGVISRLTKLGGVIQRRQLKEALLF